MVALLPRMIMQRSARTCIRLYGIQPYWMDESIILGVRQTQQVMPNKLTGHLCGKVQYAMKCEDDEKEPTTFTQWPSRQRHRKHWLDSVASKNESESATAREDSYNFDNEREETN